MLIISSLFAMVKIKVKWDDVGVYDDLCVNYAKTGSFDRYQPSQKVVMHIICRLQKVLN